MNDPLSDLNKRIGSCHIPFKFDLSSLDLYLPRKYSLKMQYHSKIVDDKTGLTSEVRADGLFFNYQCHLIYHSHPFFIFFNVFFNCSCTLVAPIAVPFPTPALRTLKRIIDIPRPHRIFPVFRWHSHLQPVLFERFPESSSPCSIPQTVAAKADTFFDAATIIARCDSPEKKKYIFTGGWRTEPVLDY